MVSAALWKVRLSLSMAGVILRRVLTVVGVLVGMSAAFFAAAAVWRYGRG